VARIAQAMFSTPVERIYDYDINKESARKAVDILEKIYRVHNFIDSVNVERGKKLNASCEIVTVWKVFEKESIVEDEIIKYKLSSRTYSEMDGYSIYANTDENGELLVVSIGYKNKDNIEYRDVYINGAEGIKQEFHRYVNKDKWALDDDVPQNPKPLEVFPVAHLPLPEPVWGGSAGTNLVEQLEEMESYQGLYIKRNALPTFTIDYGEPSGTVKSSTTESSSDSRRIIELGKGGSMQDVTWEGAEKAITGRYNRIRNAFFEQVQMPDISFANMINSNTSAENKELLFSDAKAKARDLGGEWEQFFFEELEIVKKFVSIILPKYAKDLASISVRSSIKPYAVKSKKETAEYVNLAGGAMSLETKVRLLGDVDDVTQEVELIQNQNQADANNFL